MILFISYLWAQCENQAKHSCSYKSHHWTEERGDLSELGIPVIEEPFNTIDPWWDGVGKVISRLTEGQVLVATNKLESKIINKLEQFVSITKLLRNMWEWLLKLNSDQSGAIGLQEFPYMLFGWNFWWSHQAGYLTNNGKISPSLIWIHLHILSTSTINNPMIITSVPPKSFRAKTYRT